MGPCRRRQLASQKSIASQIPGSRLVLAPAGTAVAVDRAPLRGTQGSAASLGPCGTGTPLPPAPVQGPHGSQSPALL